MIGPGVFAGMKQRHHFSRLRIDTRKVNTLAQIAGPAGQREIIQIRRASVRPCGNVFQMEFALESRLRQMAILAAVFCAREYFTREIQMAFRRDWRAFDCHTASRLPTSI